MSSFQGDRLTPLQPLLTRNLTPWPLSRCDDAVQQKFSPAALRHSSRSLRCKIPKPPKGEGVLIDASRRRRAVRCRGRKGRPPASKGTHIMPTIGSFSHDDLFGQEGILETRTLKTRVKFVPLKDRGEKQPDYRILAGKRANRRGLVAHFEERRRLSLPQAYRPEPAGPGGLQSLQERERPRRPLDAVNRKAPAQAGASPVSRVLDRAGRGVASSRTMAHNHYHSIDTPLSL